jgi:glycosyltransferase involved in cell wall biosynthesis
MITSKNKSIVHFSTTDNGGAGYAAYKFHKLFIENKYESRMFVQNKTIDDSTICQAGEVSHLVPKIFHKLETTLNLIDRRYCYFDKGRSTVLSLKNLLCKLPIQIDVICLHWISGFVSLGTIQELQRIYKCKVYWYILDMAPMTGGCHYAWNCTNYKSDCLNCPATRWPYNRKSHRLLQWKKNIINNMKIELLAPSKWLESQLKSSFIFNNTKIHRMLISVNEVVFSPINDIKRKYYKNLYNIDNSKRVISFGTSNFSDKRKGVKYLLEALSAMPHSNDIVIVTSGNFDIEPDSITKLGYSHTHLGYLNDERALSIFYKISDIFISTSIEDSGPMMINESIMCGTPVVSFDMGVASDLIIENKTGYVAKLKDSNDLSFGIQKILELNEGDHQQMRDNCRMIGLEKISASVQMKKISHILNKSEKI